MLHRHAGIPSRIVAITLVVVSSIGIVRGDEKDAPAQVGKAAGLLLDKGDNWVTVKADGEETATKYFFNTADKTQADGMKGIFNAARVRLTYKTVDGQRHLTGIRKQILAETGTVTGTVVQVHNNFWVEVKPKNGPADGFAPGANYNDPKFMALLRGLQPGDTVTIAFHTDFERHRIDSLVKNASAGSSSSSGVKQTPLKKSSP